jgi:uncharacterized protein DUF2795
MERNSNLHGPRLDDELAHEVESLTRGAPVEARIEEARAIEVAADGEPTPEAVVAEIAAERSDPIRLGHDEVRARSELAIHLLPSRFPTNRAGVLESARGQHAPDDILELLEQLPEGQYANVEAVWEALGGRREQRTRPTSASAPTDRPRTEATVELEFDFAFDPMYRLAALPFGVRPETARVSIDERGAPPMLHAEFGPWSVATPLRNVAGADVTGPYASWKTIGPPHVSLADGGLTFATTARRGVCIRFREPVRGLEPFGVVRHSSLTVTVREPDALRAALEPSSARAG